MKLIYLVHELWLTAIFLSPIIRLAFRHPRTRLGLQYQSRAIWDWSAVDTSGARTLAMSR